MSTLPLVSCILPTRNRRRFVNQAIWYFLRQDYPQRELIIVDDGEDAVADLVPSDLRIRYQRLPQRTPLGVKRNMACEASSGELIAHWDDDDWMAAHRLRVQVAQLLASDAEVCGIGNLLYYRLNEGQAWSYRPPNGDWPSVLGGTLLYRRACWQAHRFPETNAGEDSAFMRRVNPARVQIISDSSLYVALIHPGSTTARNLADPAWQRRPFNDLDQLLACDRDFYVEMRTTGARPAARPTPATLALNVAAPVAVSTGYGSMAEYLVRSMARAGAAINVQPLSLNLEGMSEEFLAILRQSRPDRNGPMLYYHWICDDIERYFSASDLFVYTMWESDRLPVGWAERMNHARAVIVPSQFVADVCRRSGVRVPVEVIPEGIDPDVYHYEQHPERAGITTLIVAPVAERKHTLQGITAWKQAFADDPDARLIIKTNYNYHNYTPDDYRIQYVDANEPQRGIAHWYREADVLLALGNEGFGLPLVEGMATGLPVIALNSEGQADVCAAAGDCLLPVAPASWEPDVHAEYVTRGMRGVPSVADIVTQLRWVRDNRAEARAMGRTASEWALHHRNVWTRGPAVLDVIACHSRSARPLRRTSALWVPSWQTACGVAEYTAQLAAALPMTRVSAAMPNLSGTHLLHIQHEFGLFDDLALTYSMQMAHQAHVPLIVTEHSVRAEARSWEREADVLTALTQHGTETLRRRWPGKRVEWLPMGCPTWFPPRKTARGRTIGVFGFLEWYKGFWQLLDVLRQLPDTELLMFSHPRNREMRDRWALDAAGLPVRWVSDYLPSETIARRLAAEADMLVFWYNEVDIAVASYAVRIGLATGVPVLASPTSWFADLADVTYQPPNLLDGVQQLLDDTALRDQLSVAARDFCHAHSWARVAERHLALWRTL